jgi:hypothetical protein
MSAISQIPDDIRGDQASKTETVERVTGSGVVVESVDGASSSDRSRIDVVVVVASDADVAATDYYDAEACGAAANRDTSGGPPLPLQPLPNVPVAVEFEDYNDYDERNAVENDPDEDGDEDDDLPFPGYVPTAFYYFDQTKQPRQWCLQLITWPYPFDRRRLAYNFDDWARFAI